MGELDIAEVAARSGLATSALRYYEERGLIEPVGRRGLRRIYDDEVVERLAIISIARTAGFSLDEIGGMFGADGRLDLDRSMLTAKADELDRTIRRLTAFRDGLRHAAACPAPSHLECPTFRRILSRSVARPTRTRTGGEG